MVKHRLAGIPDPHFHDAPEPHHVPEPPSELGSWEREHFVRAEEAEARAQKLEEALEAILRARPKEQIRQTALAAITQWGPKWLKAHPKRKG